MGFNQEKDAQQKAETRKRILEAGFLAFTERSIESVTMTDVAEAAGIGVATVYRHFPNKLQLVVEIGAWSWTEYLSSNRGRLTAGSTAAQQFRFFLDSFLDLYRNHIGLLRFNQMFNVYVEGIGPEAEQMDPYMNMTEGLVKRLRAMYRLGKADGTLRTDMPEQEMISFTLHLMLAVVTRYAVGLVYTDGSDPEKELMILRDLLMDRFVIKAAEPQTI